MLSDHYKLLPVDLCDIQRLNDVIALANLDPRYVLGFIFFLPLLNQIGLLHSETWFGILSIQPQQTPSPPHPPLTPKMKNKTPNGLIPLLKE